MATFQEANTLHGAAYTPDSEVRQSKRGDPQVSRGIAGQAVAIPDC
jgi:hypothetical protein